MSSGYCRRMTSCSSLWIQVCVRMQEPLITYNILNKNALVQSGVKQHSQVLCLCVSLHNLAQTSYRFKFGSKRYSAGPWSSVLYSRKFPQIGHKTSAATNPSMALQAKSFSSVITTEPQPVHCGPTEEGKERDDKRRSEGRSERESKREREGRKR